MVEGNNDIFYKFLFLRRVMLIPWVNLVINLFSKIVFSTKNLIKPLGEAGGIDTL